MLYKATALDEPANSSAEQPTNEGGSPSSDGKGNEISGKEQGEPVAEATVVLVEDAIGKENVRLIGEPELASLDGADGVDKNKKRALETVSISHYGKHQQTAISSADGAKETATIAGYSTNKATGVSNACTNVLTNLENHAKVYEEKKMHIYKDHFGNNEKDKGQNIPLDIEDVRSLVDVISKPNKVVFFKESEENNRNMF